MNSPPNRTCAHTTIRIVAKWHGADRQHPWDVIEVCGEERCSVMRGVLAREPNKKLARRMALHQAQQNADAIGRSVEVRVLSEPGKRSVGYYVARPESQSTGLVKFPDIGPNWVVLILLFGAATALFTLGQSHLPASQGTDWANGIITALAVVASIVIAASSSVASRMATDHRGPWIPRRDIMTRAAGLNVLGVFVLAMTFLAAFFPFVYVRYVAFAFAIPAIALMLPELVHMPRRLTSFAIDAHDGAGAA